jgi:phospholipid transport system substrate-binding protein
MTPDNRPIGRRGVLGFAAAALGASVAISQRAVAQAAGGAAAAAPILRLNDALLAEMKQGSRAPFAQRFNALAPVIDQTFDLPTVLASSIGLRWQGLPQDQKAQLLAAFRRYTVSSYAANFDKFTGQRFEVSPATRPLGNDQVVVPTTVVAGDGSSNKLDYVMRRGPSGWRAVDVLADGSISRVAVQRSDFRHLLATGGVPALVAGLKTKVSNLSGGMLA